MDSEAKTTTGNNTIARQHIDGLDELLGGDELTKRLNEKPTGPDGKVADPLYKSRAISDPIWVKYKSGRMIGLYTLSMVYNDPQSGDEINNSPSPLRIGHEVGSFPTGSNFTQLDYDPSPPFSAFAHYHQYSESNNAYHVVIRS